MKDPLSEEVIISVMKQLLELAPKQNIPIDTQSVLILDNWTVRIFGGCENKE